MDLVVFELGIGGDFSQDPITCDKKPTANMDLVAVRPHLWIQGSPGGTLKMQLFDTNGKLITESATRTISTMKSATYAHGFYYFVLQAALKKNVTYRFALASGGGYSADSSNFVGWCNAYDLGRQFPSYDNSVGVNAPLNIELWTKQILQRGVA